MEFIFTYPYCHSFSQVMISSFDYYNILFNFCIFI